jgi:hypothetical protein
VRVVVEQIEATPREPMEDRVLFGNDVWEPSECPVYFRTLETADEYFD